MKKLNTIELKSYWDRLNKMDRIIPINSTSKKCQKETFVRRTLFKLYKKRYFKWLERKETDYWTKDKTYYPDTIHYSCISYIEYYLGYGEEIGITYIDAHEPLNLKYIKLKFHDLLNIELEEIDSKKYNKILKMFYIPPVLKDYTFLCFSKDASIIKEFNVSYSSYTKEAAYEELSKDYIVMKLVKETKSKKK